MSSSSCGCDFTGSYTLDYNMSCRWDDHGNVQLKYNASTGKWQLAFYRTGKQVLLYELSQASWNCCGPNTMALVKSYCVSAPPYLTINPGNTSCCSSSSSSSRSSSSISSSSLSSSSSISSSSSLSSSISGSSSDVSSSSSGSRILTVCCDPYTIPSVLYASMVWTWNPGTDIIPISLLLVYNDSTQKWEGFSNCNGFDFQLNIYCFFQEGFDAGWLFDLITNGINYAVPFFNIPGAFSVRSCSPFVGDGLIALGYYADDIPFCGKTGTYPSGDYLNSLTIDVTE